MIIFCIAGLIIVAADDVTGVGVADDFLYIPLLYRFEKGLMMVEG